MSNITFNRGKEGGMALVSSLLLLVVVTIMAIAMFRSYGLQEKIAGNIREKQRAFHAAQTAEQYAEWWLAQSGNATASAPIVCSSLVDAVLGQSQICSNSPTDSTNGFYGGSAKSVPWKIGATDVGITYVPPFSSISTALGMNVSTDPTSASQSTSSSGVYYQKPRFYISDLGLAADASGEVYQIDAAGFGSTKDAAAVVESTFEVGAQSWRADQP